MATVALTKDTFDEAVQANEIVLVDFWASWCGPCHAFAPIFEATSEEHDDVLFAKVDVDAEPELAGSFQVMSIPTLMVLRDGVTLFAQPGMLPAQALEDLVRQTRELDMDEVRRQMAQERESA